MIICRRLLTARGKELILETHHIIPRQQPRHIGLFAGGCLMLRLRERLRQQATRNFVGRRQDIEQLLYLVSDGEIPVVFVHGIDGIGKSSLLTMFAAEAQASGTVVIRLDCRTIKPSPDGFVHELNNAIGGNSADVEQVTARLSQLGGRVILTLDTYEVFRMMDTWLRQVFIPALSDSVHIVFCGREAPVAAWHTTPGWEGMFQSIKLGPLSRDEAEALLLQCGVAETDTHKVIQFTHGHPLALKLAAATITERPDLNLKEVESQQVVTELTRLYMADVPDPVSRVALEAASVIRRTTPSLLEAMLPEIAPNDAYDRLQSLPFVDSASDGLMIHDLVQQAIATRLRSTDPERYHHYRRLAWHQLRSEFSVGSRAAVWRYTADMLYLIDHPGIHDVFFPTDVHLYAVEAATPNDKDAVMATALRHWGLEMLDILQYWWQVQPSAFYVARGRGMEIAGFYCMLKVQPLADEAQFKDSITRTWWQHLQANPIPERQLALFILSSLDAETGYTPGAVRGSLWLDIKRTYMEYPQTRRVYTVSQKPEIWVPILESLGFRELAPTQLDGKQHTCMVNDFGPQLVPGWMAGLVDAQLGVAPPVVLDVEARALRMGGTLAALTPLEFELIRYLIQNEGKAISRDELLNSVWGYEYTGGSNVVDGMVRSLRKKLGDYSACIESVSGVGYKLHWR